VTNELEVWLDDAEFTPAPVRVGVLVRSAAKGREVLRFRYATEWLANRRASFALDPELPLTSGDFFPSSGRPIFGVFRDLAPDRWGRVLMERREAEEAREAGRAARRLSEWDFLAGVNDLARLGALRLREPVTARWIDHRAPGVPPMARLRELEAAARELDATGAIERAEYPDWLRLLVVPGSSLGGARPKASFVDPDGGLWLAKFPSSSDRHDVGAWEQLAHELALAAGLEVPRARALALGGDRRTFCVARFDRRGARRRMYASAMTLLQREDGAAASYLELAELLQLHGDAARIDMDLRQLYRRIAFSILIANRDDHLRNHGFLRTPGGWVLAPAFDLNPNPDRPDHALAIDETDPRPSLATLRSTARFYRLTDSAAEQVEREVRSAIEAWPAIARALALPAEERALLAALLATGDG